MKNTILTVLVFFAFLGICSSAWAGGDREKQDNWTGIYIGVIPAADCPGIAVVAIFNDEGRYKITYQYIDREVDVLVYTGNYKYDEAAKMITLDGKDLPPYYKLGKRGLTQLDMDGKEIKGKLAGNYKLRKVTFAT